ncbi:hypothetical protein FQN57_002039 [Myotisia sp. PD_48]|nr:hypothetical protein FQN57_002039 [Myotisia sp. PD_48]
MNSNSKEEEEEIRRNPTSRNQSRARPRQHQPCSAALLTSATPLATVNRQSIKMSFFGFDTKLPEDRPQRSKPRGIFETTDPFAEVARATADGQLHGDDDVIDFEDTYDGLGDQLDETNDELNDDTFGASAGDTDQPVGKDFDFFGNTAQMMPVLGEEQVIYHLNRGSSQDNNTAASDTTSVLPQPSLLSLPKRTGYEKYQDAGNIPDIQAKSSVWGTSAKPKPMAETAKLEYTAISAEPARRMLSLEEVEAQMRAHPYQPPPQPQQQQHFQQPPQQHLQQYPQQQAQQQPPLISPPQTHPPIPPFPVNLPPGVLPPPMPFPNQRPGPPDGHLPFPADEFPPIGGHQPYPPAGPAQPPYPGQTPRQPNPPAARGSRTKLPLNLMQKQQRRFLVPSHGQAGPEQIHAELQPGQPNMPIPPSGPMHANLADLPEEQRNAFLEEDAKRAKRNHKIFVLSKGNGLMTPQDKNFITRIQLQQLVAATGNTGDSNPDSLLAEDFYYQVYRQIRGAPRQHPRQPLGLFAQTYLPQTGGRSGGSINKRTFYGENHMQRMQQQVQRAVEAAKLKPKNKQLIIEGSLGKISFSNAKAPKSVLNIKRPESSDGQKLPTTAKKTAQSALSANDRKSILRNIENVYTVLLNLEHHIRAAPPTPEPGDAEAVEKHMEWRQRIPTFVQKLWQEMRIMEPITPGASVVHPFIAFLSYPKGKKCMPRIFHHLDQEQKITVLTMIIVHFDTLDVVQKAILQPGETQPPGPVREEIETFSSNVMPCFLSYISEAPINIIIGLVGLIFGQTNVQTIAKTRVGLGILTMLLSRAELVKEAGPVPEQDLMQWIEAYNRLFDALEPILGDIFPGNINSGGDMYVWQFLAALGIGSSPEQQQRLVIAVKDRVMETVAQSKTLPANMASQRLGNVNLFMRAIGLDVELLD